MLSSSALRALGLTALIGAIALVASWPTAPPAPLWRSTLREPFTPYAPHDSDVVQFVGPMLGTASSPGVTVSGLLADAAARMPVGSASDRAGLLVAVLAATAALLAFALATRLRLGWFAALVTGLTVVSFVQAWTDAVFPTERMVLAASVYGILLAVVDWGERGRGWTLGLALMVHGMVLSSSPAVVLLLPGLVAYVLADQTSRRTRRLALVVAFVGVTGLGLVYRAAVEREAWAGAWFNASDSALGSGVEWGSGDLAVLAGLLPAVDGPDPAALARVALTWISERLGILGLTLVLCGTLTLGWARRRPLVLLGLATLTPLIWAIATSGRDPRLLLGLGILPAIVLAGAGVRWAMDACPSRPSRVVVGFLLLLLPATGLANNYDRSIRLKNHLALLAGYFDRMLGVLPANAVILADSEPLDRALITAVGPGLRRAPQNAKIVRWARDNQYPVFGFERATGSLLKAGFQRSPVEVPRLTFGLSPLLDMLPPRAVLAAAIAPGFTAAVPPTGRPTFDPVGGTVDLLGKSRWHYGLVGVRGTSRPVREHLMGSPVDFTIEAGEPIGETRIPSPVTFRVISNRREGRILVNGSAVAETSSGLALVALTPDGARLAVQSLEATDVSRISPEVREPRLYRIR